MGANQAETEQPTISLPLRLTHNIDLDQLEAVPINALADRAGSDRWRPVSDRAAYLLDAAGGSEIGFVVQKFSTVHDDASLEGMWDEPRFDAPVLGLRMASAGELTLAADAFYGGVASVSQRYFHEALRATGDAAVRLWRNCLECGDLKAHYGLGYTLLDLGRIQEAYRHLRYYAELAPSDAWAQCYYGRAAEICGHRGEARNAYMRGAELEDLDEPTDSAELLTLLEISEEGDLSWVQRIVPYLTDAQAFSVVRTLVAEGVAMDQVQRAVGPHLPAPGNGLRRQRPRRVEGTFAAQRRALLDYESPDPLLAAVEDYVFTLVPAKDASHWNDVVLWVDRDGMLHADLRSREAPIDLDDLGTELRQKQPDRFAVLSCQLSCGSDEVAVLLGAAPARSDALVTTIERCGSGRRRLSWREPEDPAPMRSAKRIMAQLRGQL